MFTNQRLFDLIRYQRSELFDAELITMDEYAELAKDHAAVARLEDYDKTKTRLEDALRLIQSDPHQWSIRPCPTCQSVSEVAGMPFGCILYAKARTGMKT